jgi:predicted RNA-binding protein with PUA-like domain
MNTAYWLLKTESETYSFEQLLKDKKTNWNGVRNFQARKYLKQIQKNDLALIYHSGKDKSVVGIAKAIREAYPDPDPKKEGDWVQIDLAPVQIFKQPVPLSQIKAHSLLKDMPLIRQSRLSVMPISKVHFQTLLKLGGLE